MTIYNIRVARESEESVTFIQTYDKKQAAAITSFLTSAFPELTVYTLEHPL